MSSCLLSLPAVWGLCRLECVCLFHYFIFICIFFLFFFYCDFIFYCFNVASVRINVFIMSVSSRYKFFWERPAAKFLCKFYSSVGTDLGVRAVSPISEVWSWRHWHGGCVHSLSWHIVLLEDKELITDLAHDRQLLLCQNYVIVIRVG